MMDAILTTTTCPICNKKILWTTENPFRPFCSKRCQLIDLGEWIKGNYVISEEKEEED